MGRPLLDNGEGKSLVFVICHLIAWIYEQHLGLDVILIWHNSVPLTQWRIIVHLLFG